jgi:prepilin-type N-terminal cleavage/methylation domain-containing protein
MTAVKPTRRAFTLVELLIVIGVIAILVGLALAIGHRVAGAGKETKTTDAIKVLDASVAEFVASSGGIPPATVLDPRRTNPPTNNPAVVQPVADAYTNAGSGGLINSVGLYMTQCEKQPSASAVFKTLDAKFMRELDTDGNEEAWDAFPPLRTVFDGWDRPIRYVHPAWDGLLDDAGTPVTATNIVAPPAGKNYFNAGLTLTRIAPYADGGICRGGQPYFYSAGPDGDPSTVADNVYTTKPQVEKN